MSKDPVFQKKINDKLAQRESLLPKDIVQLVKDSIANDPSLTPIERIQHLLNDSEKSIIALTPSQIVQRTTIAKDLTCVEIVKVYIKASTIAQVLTNCITEVLFEKAIQRAKYIDEQFAKTGKPLGSLHGVPISLKDNLNLADVESSYCFVAWIGNIAKENTYMCDIMLEQGAVFYCKTPLPVTGMTAETLSNVFGVTTNPYNISLTPGGSSGGESALISIGGSNLGIGTDIAGSVRIPAMCCGIYALKPSTGRIPPKGGLSATPGQESLPATHGPMSRSIDGLNILMKTFMDAEPWQTCNKTVPIPWRSNIEPQVPGKWVFGVMKNDGVYHPHPPVARALEDVVEKIKKAGHEVVEWVPGNYHAKAHDLANKIFRADSCKRFRSLLEQGKEDPIGPILVGNDAITGKVDYEVTVNQLWELHAERNGLTNMHLKHWRDTAMITSTGKPIDGLLCPAAPHMAPPHGQYKDLSQTALFNLFDHTAAVFPVPGSEISQKDVDSFDKAKHVQSIGKPFNEMDEANWKNYDPKNYRGPPVGIQIAGRRYEEEKVIEMLKVIESALSK